MNKDVLASRYCILRHGLTSLLCLMLLSTSVVAGVDIPVQLSEAEWQSIKNQVISSMTKADDPLAANERSRDTKSTDAVRASNLLQSDYIKPFNTDANDQFGFEVAISGSTLVVGARLEDSNGSGSTNNPGSNSLANSGAAYVFVLDGSGWTQQAYLKASNPDAGDQFGRAVDIHGDTIVVGAYLEDSSGSGVNGTSGNSSTYRDSGAAYIFTRSGDVWTQEAYLKASNPYRYDYFGESVSVYGNTVVVGASREDSSTTGINPGVNDSAVDSGAVYVFVKQNGAWSQQAFIKASNTGAYDYFGFDVSLWGDRLAVGSYLDDSDASVVNGSQGNASSGTDYGSAYIFQRNNGLWAQQAYIKPPNPDPSDQFGVSVSLSNDILVVGAYLEDSNATALEGSMHDNSAAQSGAAYVFKRNTDGAWVFFDYLKASNTGAHDQFGRYVEVYDNTIVVGARLEDGSSNVINGVDDNDHQDSGAVYHYVLDETEARFVSYIKANNSGSGDIFGTSLAISESIIAVASPYEDSNSIIINSGALNNDAVDAGAAHIFVQAQSFHPVGGLVLGLEEGNSIVLRNNGVDDLTITENGNFRFGPLYSSGETFDVSVDVTGTNPHQECMLVGAQGPVNDQSYNAILVDCRLNTLFIRGDINTVNGAEVTIPVELSPDGLAIAAVAFSIDYDPACLNPDRDNDGVLDIVNFNVPGDFTTAVDYDPTNSTGEIFISIADIAAPLGVLSAGVLAEVVFFVDCLVDESFVDIAVQFGDSPQVSFGGVDGLPVTGSVGHGGVRIWDGAVGDCNVDSGLEAGDLNAVALEIADDDGDNYLNAPDSDFFGGPQGCDANGNELITAADAACINLLLRGDVCAPIRTPSNDGPPELNVSIQAAQDIVWLQANLQHHGTALAGVSYRLELDLSEFDTNLLDLDRNGYVDERNLRFPEGQPGVFSARWSFDGTLGYLDVLLLDTAQNQIAEGLVLEVGIPMAGVPTGGVVFSQQRETVFASTGGVDVEGISSIGDLISSDSFE